MSKTVYDRIMNIISHNYVDNYEVFKNVLELIDERQCEPLPSVQHGKLKEMQAACVQLGFFRDELNLDISEVDVRRYTIDDDYRGKLFDLQNLKKVFESAGGGDVESMMLLACEFHAGHFSPGLSRYEAEWCEKAAEAGDVTAMLAMGSNYRWGEGGVFADPEKALYWYGKAAEAGDEDAILFMKQFGDGKSNQMLEMSAVSGIEGFGTKWYRSRYFIREWFERADGGDAECQYEVGRALMPYGESGAFRRSTRESIRYYEMAARQGVVDAMFNLANTYRDGWSDLEPDPEKEFYWRKKAADAGDMEASYMLGKMYAGGKGTYEDFGKAMRYLKIAVDSEEVAPQMVSCYESVCRIEKIYEANKERIVPINSDFYSVIEEKDRRHLQEYLNRIMQDLGAAMETGDGGCVRDTYVHVVTLIEMVIQLSEPVIRMSVSGEGTEEEVDMLIRRFLYHYMDAIGDDGFYREIAECAGIDEKKCRQQCHKDYSENAKNILLSVQKVFPDCLEALGTVLD